ncbi:MAG: hypothetical protein V5B40_03130 [Candidatus Accumulibacter meliphilus]|jgi:hypothetical protein|uniref:hypothetical protein n=1 Tax=Candidatus Accumulibacter meliphilus TaxID=2211374 RepID=UPI002FC27FAC
MSTAIERRLMKLKQAAQPGESCIDLICRRIISPDGDNEIVRAQIDDRILKRNADETEDAFVGRVKAEARARTTPRARRLILLPEEKQQ